ncbi:hypothetical protein KAM472_37770 [Aeromonas caviae]|nr:hypothetical protein KAM471c_16930 [Aeromonas caviae]GJA14581.1 hypothetical protein KAM335_17770 [Aeromonas caviae]GJA23939.1 hypothetical protein KAM337_24670 [Aeromonas caviae]GJA36146.1 hypothetical protein KAM342_13890 [Aeromonas caviae]GJA49791.1 hypothetical protein KAM347_15820 [Aeromonas caviae]
MIEDGQGRPQQQQAAQGAYPDQQLTPHSRFLSKSVEKESLRKRADKAPSRSDSPTGGA